MTSPSKVDGYPKPLDFASTWMDYTHYNMHARASDANEIAFWQKNATGYAARVQDDPTSYTQTLAALQALVRPDDSLLDVGAGTGRFALPLAKSVEQVTALDLSPDMLAILNDSAETQGISNIQSIRGNWEDTPVEPHDVVLAAWSLYRQQDILASLQKLVNATHRTLIIIDGDHAPRPDDDPPHKRLITEIWGTEKPTSLCNYLYFAGMLRQCRVRAEIKLVYEHITRTAPDVTTLANSLAPSHATEDERVLFAERLTPYAKPDLNGCTYTCRVVVGLVVWQRMAFA